MFNDKPTEQYLAEIHALDFFELISRPTRFPPPNQRAKPSLLDHIYTNNIDNCISGILKGVNLDITGAVFFAPPAYTFTLTEIAQ